MPRRLLLLPLLLALMLSGVRAEPVEVTLFEGGEGVDFYQAVADKISAQDPASRVTIDADPAIADKLRIRVMEGRFPEVTNASLDVWNLIAHDQIQPLDQWLDGPSWDGKTTWRDTFLPGTLDRFTRDGKTYGVPLVYVVWSVYYDKALFRRHGWKPPRTWPEMFALCERMKAQGLTPMAFQGRYNFYAIALVRSAYYQLAGSAAYDAQQELKPGSYDNPAMVEALDLLRRLAREDFQKGSSGMSHTEAQLEFFQGRACMLMCGSWLFSEMRDNIPEGFELGAFPLPLPESAKADSSAGYDATDGYWFVFKNSANPKGGADFLRCLTSTEVAKRFAAERGMTMAIKGGNDDLHPMMEDVARQLERVKRTYGKLPGPSIPGMDQVWSDTLARLLGDPSFSATEAAKMMEEGATAARLVHDHPDQVRVLHPRKTAALLAFLAFGLLLAIRRPSWARPLTAGIRRRDILLFIAPALLLYLAFFILPSLVALIAACTRWDGLGAPQFVGALNFRRLLLESDVFWSAFCNNLYLMLVIPGLVLPVSLLLANALHHGVWGSRMFRIAFFFPNLLGVAGILLWQQLYNPQGGPVNAILVGLGFSSFQGFPWLAPENLYHALIPMGVWGACGFNMVLFLAAMQSVPEDLYEAAELYGANAWQKFWGIALPLIWPTVVAALLFSLIGGMKAFETIWLLTNQSPTSGNHVIGTLMVRSMFVEQRIGQAAAIACVLFATVLVCSLLADRVLSREQD